MKKLLLAITTAAIASTAFADIQDPPMNDRGPTRKLGRALGNILYGFAEFPQTVANINTLEGNNSAASYGIVKGLGRTFTRIGSGVYEFVTFPFPTYKGSFRSPLRKKIPWINGGYEDMPPELGFQSRRRYPENNYGY